MRIRLLRLMPLPWSRPSPSPSWQQRRVVVGADFSNLLKFNNMPRPTEVAVSNFSALGLVEMKKRMPESVTRHLS